MTEPNSNKTINKGLLLFHLLLIVYPIFYFMSRNISEFSFNTYKTTLLYALKGTFWLILVYILAHYTQKKVFKTLYTGLLSVGLYLVLMATLCAYSPLLAALSTCVIIMLSHLLNRYHFIKEAALILGLMCVFSVAAYLFPLLFIHQNKTADKYQELAYKPNIYFLVLESYHGNEALKRLYNFDNALFLEYLIKNGFTVYSDIYATRPMTRTSLLSILDVNNPPDMDKKEHLLDPCLRGKIPCLVPDILKKNGYKIKTKFANNFLVKNEPNTEGSKKKFLCNTLFSERYPLYFQKCNTVKFTKYKTADDFNLDLIKTISDLKKEDTPYMFITKIGGVTEDDFTYQGGLAHLPNVYRHTNKIELLPKLKGNYLRELKKENIALTYIIQAIIKKDPNALIILIGDHGGNYFDIFKNYQAMADVKLPLKDYILDLFNVIAAVRYPYGIKTVKRFQYLPEIFPVIFDALGAPLDDLKVLPIVYDYKNNPYYKD